MTTPTANTQDEVPQWAWRISCVLLGGLALFLINKAIFERFDKIDIKLEHIEAVLFIPAIHPPPMASK